MSTFTQDIKTAIKSMASATFDFIRDAAQFIVIAGTIVGIMWGIGYCLINYTTNTLSTIAVIILGSWFIVELDNARFIREMEEKEKNDGKN